MVEAKRSWMLLQLPIYMCSELAPQVGERFWRLDLRLLMMMVAIFGSTLDVAEAFRW